MRARPTKPLETLADHLTYLGHDIDYCAKPAAQPIKALPGTPEKLAALKARVDAGQDLFHPDDVVDYDGLTVCTMNRRTHFESGELNRTVLIKVDDMVDDLRSRQ